MSIYLAKLRKTPKYRGEIVKYHERFVEILEEMGLEEKENDGIITYSYKGDVWLSAKISSINIYMETPILEKLTSYNQNNPLLCFAKSYDYLVRKCQGTSTMGFSFLSLALLLSSYMTHITHGAFKSKLINWDD